MSGRCDALGGIFLKKCLHTRDVLERDSNQCLPLIDAGDTSCGVEALDELSEGVFVRDWMMIRKVIPVDKEATQCCSASSAGMLD